MQLIGPTEVLAWMAAAVAAEMAVPRAKSVGVAAPGSDKVEIVEPSRVVARHCGALCRESKQRQAFFFGQQLASGARWGPRLGVMTVRGRSRVAELETCATPAPTLDLRDGDRSLEWTPSVRQLN